MKVKILRGVVVKTGPALAGSIVDLEANDAFLLINSNKAVLVTEEEEPAPVEIEPEVEPTPAAVVAPTPVRRTRKPRSSKE